MRKLAEQRANSFCYLVQWIDTGDVWGPFLYWGENATQEFVRRIDEELVCINEVLAIKVERIVSEEYKRQFEKAEVCQICKEKFLVDKEEVKYLEIRKDFINGKIKKIEKKLDDNKTIIQTLVEEIEVLKEKNDKDKVKSLESKKEVINKEIKNVTDERKLLVTSLLKIVKEIKILETRDDKVWEHCHITDKFWGRHIIHVILNFRSSHRKPNFSTLS